MLELVWMAPGDTPVIERAAHLFDHDVNADWAERFLAQPNGHLCIASLDGAPAGFVTGVEITRPDKGTEMLLDEWGVDDDLRRRGVGGGLCRALAARARERGCIGMWVPVDDDDEPALATYRSLAPDEESRTRIIRWDPDAGRAPARAEETA